MNATQQIVLLDLRSQEIIEERKLPKLVCNGCTQCCRYNIRLTKFDDWGTYKHLGGVLKRRPDGYCTYSMQAGCSIYERRPHACRNFDCRTFVAMNRYTDLRKMHRRLRPMIREGKRRLREARSNTD